MLWMEWKRYKKIKKILTCHYNDYVVSIIISV